MKETIHKIKKVIAKINFIDIKLHDKKPTSFGAFSKVQGRVSFYMHNVFSK